MIPVAVDRIGQVAAAGARLIVFPEAFLGGYPNGFDFGARVGTWRPTMRHIALEGRCFVLSACQYVPRGFHWTVNES